VPDRVARQKNAQAHEGIPRYAIAAA